MYSPHLYDCYDRQGTFYGIFENDRLIAVAVLESTFIGKNKDKLQLKFLHVSRAYRSQDVGQKLFTLSADRAHELGDLKLYISATPSENTINFYLNLGCELSHDLDPDLYKLEPEDIHLKYVIPSMKI